MIHEVVIPWLDFGMKYGVLLFGIYYLFMRCVSEKRDMKKLAAAAFFSVTMGVSMIWLRQVIDPMHLALLLIYIALTNCLLYRHELGGKEGADGRMKLRDILAISLLCFAFCEAVFMLVGFVSSAVLSVLYYNFLPSDCNSVWDFLNNKPVHICAYIVMIAMVWISIYLFAKTRRLRQGLMNIVRHQTAGIVIMIAMMMLSIVVAFGGIGMEDEKSLIKTILLIPTMLFCVIMLFWTRHEIRVDFIGDIRQRNLSFIRGSLANKEKQIAKVVQDNENLAALIRRDMELLRQLTEASNRNDGAGQASDVIDRLYAGRCATVRAMESYGRAFQSTGVNFVDSMLNLMACKAQDRGVDFEVNVGSDISGLIGAGIERREFNTLLADLAENAIISAGAAKERHVEVMLLRNDENYCLEVLDSGDRFDLGVLKNMGKKRITTHSGEGGSGIGLMTLFKILGETGASFTMEEFPGTDNHSHFSKALSVTFDGKGKFRIITDRADELRQVMKSDRFVIEGR